MYNFYNIETRSIQKRNTNQSAKASMSAHKVETSASMHDELKYKKQNNILYK